MEVKPPGFRGCAKRYIHIHVKSYLCTLVLLRYNREKYRKKKICPVPGCTSKEQKKLSNHLKIMHPGLTQEDRQKLLQSALVAERPFIPQIRDQRKLGEFFL